MIGTFVLKTREKIIERVLEIIAKQLILQAQISRLDRIQIQTEKTQFVFVFFKLLSSV